jgi:hypothetical protein
MFWKNKYFPTLSRSAKGLIMVPRLKTKSLKLGATDNRALFMVEKIPPIGAKASAVPFTKLSSEGLFW